MLLLLLQQATLTARWPQCCSTSSVWRHVCRASFALCGLALPHPAQQVQAGLLCELAATARWGACACWQRLPWSR